MRITEEQYRQFLGKKALKYHNNKVQYNGITFDSIKEKNRYLWLKTLEEEGKISELELQKKFLLQEGFIHEGKKERPIYYIADFYYFDKKLNCYIAEDVKSEITRQDKVYRLKRKIFIHEFPWIAFKEVL
jgi:hypothetical protein